LIYNCFFLTKCQYECVAYNGDVLSSELWNIAICCAGAITLY